IDNDTSSRPTVTDADSPNFDMGNMKVSISANGDADDLLSIEGNASGPIAVSANTVTFQGRRIGTFTGGRGAIPLVITFNANATPAATQALLRRVAYASLSPRPPIAARTIMVLVDDGDGGISAPATKRVIFQNR